PGHLINVTYPDASALTYVYDPNGLITAVNDVQGKTIEAHSYDSQRRGLSSQKSGGTDSLSVGYNGNLASLSDSAGHSTQCGAATFLANRGYITSISGSGCDTCGGRGNYSFTYDSQGNRLTSTDPLGHLTKFSYDSNANIKQKQVQSDSTGSNFQTWSYTYNSFSEVLTATDPLGHATTNAYDSKGNLLTSTGPS